MKSHGELLEIARTTIEKMASVMTRDYLASVEENIDDYSEDYLPNEDDFFAWVEGWYLE